MKTKLFMPLINSPTRITLTSGSTIYHIWSDDVNQVNESFSGILTSKITDHFTVFTKLNINYNRHERVLKTFRDHSERALSNFSIELQNFFPIFRNKITLIFTTKTSRFVVTYIISTTGISQFAKRTFQLIE